MAERKETILEEDARAVEYLNELISQRTRYGMRQETAAAPSYVLSWSNGSAEWWVFSRPYRRGESASLDANQILAPYPRRQLTRISSSLMRLPLFSYSFEARQKRVEAWEAVPPEWVSEIISGLKKMPGSLSYQERLKIVLSLPAGRVPPPVAARIIQALMQEPTFAMLGNLVEELVFSYPQVATIGQRVRDEYWEE